MTVHAFRNGHVLLAGGQTVGAACLSVDKGRLTAISSDPRDVAAYAGAIDLQGGWLVPGFVDLQVNGGGGVLFNDATDVAGIRAIGAAHARYGTTAFLPTLISDNPAAIGRALEALDAAIAAGVPGVVGVHVEGPFINPGRNGIHDPSKLRRLDEEQLSALAQPRRGPVLVTLAPELAAPGQIRRLADAGVLVSIGHTDATAEQVQAALADGARGFTHLFNAMSPLHHRAPGAVGAALADRDSWCGLIADGIHVHPLALRLALQARGSDRLMLVTDAMPSVGNDGRGFMLDGREISVIDGRCVSADGTLAGAHLDMAAAVRLMVAEGGATVAEAVRMASATPAAFLRMEGEIGALAIGRRADWVWLDDRLEVRETWIGGQCVARAG
ncbi:N-acetylglucosamine-6-phosphate deacetylase [Croceibacterium ferulae]|uniref:N-acetylglucosamine-6-phosphate deacetylase n=1 Tax=Croceibacterium ferulae TaxID=1854641 RepID=UPI000EABDED8|nr:N-acetylglucosamine-6-phosphate deacetylase [Croceibacterium ferulae]